MRGSLGIQLAHSFALIVIITALGSSTITAHAEAYEDAPSLCASGDENAVYEENGEKGSDSLDVCFLDRGNRVDVDGSPELEGYQRTEYSDGGNIKLYPNRFNPIWYVIKGARRASTGDISATPGSRFRLIMLSALALFLISFRRNKSQ